jgi:TolB-like protein/Tfp pilus assembly protein PilF
MNVFNELSRRNVIRVAIAYGVASWVLLQIVDVVAPIFEVPAWAPKLVFVILAIGLVPVLLFAWAFELTPEGIKKESEVDRSGSIVTHTGRKLNYIITASLVVAVALLLIDRQMGGPDATEDETVAAIAEGEKSIAVLPFVNMSSDEEQDFFSDGITEEILNSLASEKSLKVAGRTSSFAFKGQNDDLRRIGDALGVNHILEGSVRKAGTQVRITAQLIQVDNGFHLWSETYDRELTDVFAIQDEIATEILRQLKSQLLNDESIVVVEAKRTNPVVYDLYLRAKQRIYTRKRSEIEAAITELDKAIQLDSNYAPAFAQRGIATMLLSEQQYGDIPHNESNRRGKRFIDQSLALDENLAEGYAALGLYYSRTPAEAEIAIDHLTKALSINPNLIDAGNWLQTALSYVGDHKGSMEILSDLVERDPLYRPAFSNAMMTFNAFGAQDKANELLKRMESFDPANPDLYMARAVNLLYSGRNGEGLQQMELRSESGEMSGVAKIFLSVGLMSTLQFERAVDEGSLYLRPSALYQSGRKEEGLALAYEQATSGYPESYFYLLNQEERYKDVVSFLEERWPTLSTFASENGSDAYGYTIMAEVALAYSKTGNEQRFNEAMDFIERHFASLDEQGVDNSGTDGNHAIAYAMLGDIDASILMLQDAVENGWSPWGKPTKVIPQLEPLASDPRFAELELAMLANVNRDREVVGLPPVNINYQVVATIAPTN